MGNYTELVLKCKLKSVLPEEVSNVLNGTAVKTTRFHWFVAGPLPPHAANDDQAA